MDAILYLMSEMTGELNTATEKYLSRWRQLVTERRDINFFNELQPTAVAWKVPDAAEYDRLCAELRGQCDLVISSWMDERWITKLHLKDAKLEGGIEIIKIMQRRPNSADALGLDHVDFYSPGVAQADVVLKQEPDLKWNHETNGASWISIWFDGGEAKLRTDTVLDSYIRDLRDKRNQIIKRALR